jgi:hypothetical protein
MVAGFLKSRQNVILLEDKERREKEVLSQIIKEAEDYKVGFYKKRQFTCENNKTTNREKEKVRFSLSRCCCFLCSLFENVCISAPLTFGPWSGANIIFIAI